ncbi:hypothetical protein CFK37_14360 [Virgibacillus phasianinus]|uniref:Uncharacterized protein n=1 Tax=Virgibacillus phasianinus TaxID=2017483 RepID=A0A220U521_9BACI|nr:hypothetical protein CFK37_14360 [Virgibacillus phasianinus]
MQVFLHFKILQDTRKNHFSTNTIFLCLKLSKVSEKARKSKENKDIFKKNKVFLFLGRLYGIDVEIIAWDKS